MATFEELLTARMTLFQQLVAESQKRTELRTSQADRLTMQLGRDLDGEVLRIEVKANPLADKSEFGVWLEKHIDAVFPRFKLQRRSALLASGLMPNTLRDLLLHEGTPDTSALINQHQRAEDGDSPLVIDQPEENLDNRLIRQVIVNILASMKLRRQVIIATHNPNLPVLGDAEQCVVLQATGRDLSRMVAAGSLDSPHVARYITDIMEGGREAFQYRQSIYQTHWESEIEEYS